MGCVVVKVRQNGKVQGKTIYQMIRLKQSGLKEVLGVWAGKTEKCIFLAQRFDRYKSQGS